MVETAVGMRGNYTAAADAAGMRNGSAADMPAADPLRSDFVCDYCEWREPGSEIFSMVRSAFLSSASRVMSA